MSDIWDGDVVAYKTLKEALGVVSVGIDMGRRVHIQRFGREWYVRFVR